MQKFKENVKKVWKRIIAPLLPVIIFIGAIFGCVVAANSSEKKRLKKIEDEKQKIEKQKANMTEIDLYEKYTLKNTSWGDAGVGTYSSDGKPLEIDVYEDVQYNFKENEKFKYSTATVDTKGYALKDLGKFGKDIQANINGVNENTRVSLNTKVQVTEKTKKEEAAQ